MSRHDRPGGAPDPQLSISRVIARAVADTRDGVLRPEDDAAAAGVMAAQQAAGRLLTPAVWHQIRAYLLHSLAEDPMRELDMRDADLIQVALWLRQRALTEERHADGTGVVRTTPPTVHAA